MSKPETEIVVRFCKHTNKLVLAEIVCDSNTQITCLHNDDIEEDKKQVINWLDEHNLYFYN